LKERQNYHESFDKHVVHRLPLQVCEIFIDYGFGLPQAHKRDKQDVLHAAWLYASEQKRGEVSDNAYVHGDFLQTSIYKQVTIMHILQDAYTYLEVPWQLYLKG